MADVPLEEMQSIVKICERSLFKRSVTVQSGAWLLG